MFSPLFFVFPESFQVYVEIVKTEQILLLACLKLSIECVLVVAVVYWKLFHDDKINIESVLTVLRKKFKSWLTFFYCALQPNNLPREEMAFSFRGRLSLKHFFSKV